MRTESVLLQYAVVKGDVMPLREVVKQVVIERSLFSFEEVAKRWGVSAFTVRRRVEDGSLKAVNVGARRLVPISEVQRAEQFGIGKGRKREPE